MFQIEDVWEEAKKISGICDEPKILRWLSDAVTLVANKGDLEGWKGYIDICSTDGGRCITLPREVETVYAVNIGGHPSLGLNQLFNFHLNGPGDCHQSCDWAWQDKGGNHAVYRDLSIPSKIVAYVQRPEDTGKSLIIYGFDEKGNALDTITSEGRTLGYIVPTIYGYALPDDVAPTIARIMAVVKEPTIGTIRLSTIDSSGPTGILLAVYEPDERFPQYRRIQLNRSCTWARIAYRKINPIFTSRFDHVMLKSRIGFLLAMQAVKFYSEKDTANAHAFEADAARLELEAQNATEPPTYMPVQVIDGNNLIDKSDWDIR